MVDHVADNENLGKMNSSSSSKINGVGGLDHILILVSVGKAVGAGVGLGVGMGLGNAVGK